MMCYIIYRRQYGCDPEVGRNLSKSNMQKGKPSCSTGGGGDRMAIHSQRHGVSDGKRENHPVPRGGGAGSPSSLARSWKTTKPHKWGGMPQKAEHKTAAVGEGDRRSRGISCSTGGVGRIHHDVHYLLKYKST